MTKVTCYQCGGKGLVGPERSPDGRIVCPLCQGSGVATFGVGLFGVLSQAFGGLQAGGYVAPGENPFEVSEQEDSAMDAAMRERLMGSINLVASGVGGVRVPGDDGCQYVFTDVQLFDFVKKIINAPGLVTLRGVDYWGALYGAAVDRESPQYRKPVGVAVGKDMEFVVVCDDGSVFAQLSASLNGEWRSAPAVPGTQAAAVNEAVVREEEAGPNERS